MKINGINISISGSHYNKSKIQKDEVTHKIEADKKYQMYMLELHKAYFNGTKEDVLNQIINDLEAVVAKLKKIRENDKDEEISK